MTYSELNKMTLLLTVPQLQFNLRGDVIQPLKCLLKGRQREAPCDYSTSNYANMFRNMKHKQRLAFEKRKVTAH